MKKGYIILTLLFLCFKSYGQETIFISVESDCVNSKDCHIVEDVFQESLLKNSSYTIRTFSNEGEFAKARLKELAFQESGDVCYDDIKSAQKLLAADKLMVFVIEKLEKELYFRAKLFDLETGKLMNTARYPEGSNLDDKAITNINDIRQLDIVALELLERLGYSVGSKLDITKDNNKKRNSRINNTALAYSIIPGVGLMTKGHYIEGSCYLLADVALIGGGFGALSQANKQNDLIKTGFLDRDQILQAQKKRDNAKVASYCCFGAAAAVYVVNLIRSYVAEPKNRKSFAINITPEMAPAICGKSDMFMNFALTYSF